MVESDPRRRYLRLLAAGAGTALAGCASLAAPGSDHDRETTADDHEKIDDWQYSPRSSRDSGGGAAGTGTPVSVGDASYQMSAESADAGTGDNVGLAAGGAKRIAAFRRNIEEGYLPQPDGLAPEGLFYNYYFDTGDDGSCASLFCPAYSPAVTADPLSGETERYLTVGLNSGLSASEFDRKRLNLVVVLDVSGSMSSAFSDYYYDQHGNRHEPEGDTERPKIEVARDALVALTEQLREGDRLGVVLYNNGSAVAKPLRPVEATDMDAIRGHIQEDIRANGGTNLDAGLSDATEMLREYSDADQSERENRMVVITDAMPNVGETDDGALRDRLEANAENNVHATFVGVGVDFNAELVDELTAVRGANYYAVHSADEFERRLGEEFEYMVTPLVFDLDLELDAEGYEIGVVYGSTAADEATGQLMHVNTLFASPREDGETRGGVVLVKVRRTGEDGEGGERGERGDLTLTTSWENREGQSNRTSTAITFPSAEPEQFDTAGVRKAVLLSRYADLLRNWMVYERNSAAVHDEDGIEHPPDRLGRWEQQSEPLAVSARYADRIREFREHFESEAEALGDESLDRELAIMDEILAAAE